MKSFICHKEKGAILASEHGFTLLEALAAIAILAIVMLGTGSMLFSGLSSSAGSNNRYTATALTQNKVEDLMAMPFASLSSHLTPVAKPTNGVDYRMKWRCADVSSNVRYFNISTTWNDKTGSHGISIAAVRAR